MSRNSVGILHWSFVFSKLPVKFCKSRLDDVIPVGTKYQADQCRRPVHACALVWPIRTNQTPFCTERNILFHHSTPKSLQSSRIRRLDFCPSSENVGIDTSDLLTHFPRSQKSRVQHLEVLMTRQGVSKSTPKRHIGGCHHMLVQNSPPPSTVVGTDELQTALLILHL